MSIRTSRYKVNPLLIGRWSPRAMSGEKITEEQFMTIMEAARWAPSSYNNQPWRFIYAFRETPDWGKLFNLLVPANQVWVARGAVLILVISHNNFDYNNKPSRTHTFDTGAACENMALQAFDRGLVCHGMEGFNYDRARKDLNIPDDYTVEAMFVIGKPGKKEDLPLEMQKREQPSDRKKLEEILFKGKYGA